MKPSNAIIALLFCVLSLPTFAGEKKKSPQKATQNSKKTEQPQAADNKILGVAVGEALSFPMCPADYSVKWDKCLTANPAAQKKENVDSYIFHTETPSYFKYGLDVEVSNGVVTSAFFFTKGYEVQDAVLQALVQKYGKPHEIKTTATQNSYGAQYERVSALYKFQNIVVFFDGMMNSTDAGVVTIMDRNEYDRSAAGLKPESAL